MDADRNPIAGRAEAKQAGRESDVARLAEGVVSASDLARENDFFGALAVEDFSVLSWGEKRLGKLK